MPRVLRRRRRTGNSVLPQPGPEISRLHALPHGHPWFEYRHLLLQALREAAIRKTKNAQPFQIAGPRPSKRLLAGAGHFVCWVPVARAQQAEEQKGVDQGNYNIKQSIEFGGRITSLAGDFQAYDTFVNLQQGPRLLGFTMEMRSLDHHGSLFDRFYFSNFWYGGDPYDVSRLRFGKNKWYNFDALFRKDENFWDYSLQANPLNPTTPFTNGPVGYGPPACTSCVIDVSPHQFNT